MASNCRVARNKGRVEEKYGIPLTLVGKTLLVDVDYPIRRYPHCGRKRRVSLSLKRQRRDPICDAPSFGVEFPAVLHPISSREFVRGNARRNSARVDFHEALAPRRVVGNFRYELPIDVEFLEQKLQEFRLVVFPRPIQDVHVLVPGKAELLFPFRGEKRNVHGAFAPQLEAFPQDRVDGVVDGALEKPVRQILRTAFPNHVAPLGSYDAVDGQQGVAAGYFLGGTALVVVVQRRIEGRQISQCGIRVHGHSDGSGGGNELSAHVGVSCSFCSPLEEGAFYGHFPTPSVLVSPLPVPLPRTSRSC